LVVDTAEVTATVEELEVLVAAVLEMGAGLGEQGQLDKVLRVVMAAHTMVVVEAVRGRLAGMLVV
jgi:hypothetical protein